MSSDNEKTAQIMNCGDGNNDISLKEPIQKYVYVIEIFCSDAPIIFCRLFLTEEKLF